MELNYREDMTIVDFDTARSEILIYRSESYRYNKPIIIIRGHCGKLK